MFFKCIVFYCKKTAAKRLLKGRIDAGKYEIDVDYLLTIAKQQDSKCYYSNVPLVFKRYNDWQCSLERIDASKGYIIGNVKLIALEFQSASQWTKDKYVEFIKLIKIKHEPIKINWNTIQNNKWNKVVKSILNNVVYYKCNSCSKDKKICEFNKNATDICKACNTEKCKKYAASPKGHMVKLLLRMKEKNKQKYNGNSELTLSALKEIIDKQRGLCEYSGIPMTYGSYLDKWWTCSPERKDTKIGYTKENLCFVCYEFNTTIIIDKTLSEAIVSSGWSQTKIQYIRDFNLDQNICFERLTI